MQSREKGKIWSDLLVGIFIKPIERDVYFLQWTEEFQINSSFFSSQEIALDLSVTTFMFLPKSTE